MKWFVQLVNVPSGAEIAEAKPFFLDERLKKARAKIQNPLSITSYDPYIYKPIRVPRIKVKLTPDRKIESLYVEKKRIKIPETSKAEVVSIESLLERKPKKSLRS